MNDVVTGRKAIASTQTSVQLILNNCMLHLVTRISKKLEKKQQQQYFNIEIKVNIHMEKS